MSQEKQIRLETMPSFFGVDFSLKGPLMGISLKHKGLDIPNPNISVGGAKVLQKFLIPETEDSAVEISFEDIVVSGSIVKINKTTSYFYDDGTVYCSKVEAEIVRDEEQLLRKRYERAYNYLKSHAKGTPIENHVNEILDHYSSEVSVWLLGNPKKFIDSINSESNAVIISYLDIVVHNSGKKVRDVILEQLTATPWTT